MLAVLDTTQTPELVREGQARELIRLIQDARKAADFDVADRIAVCYDAPGPLREAIQAHADWIRRETLSRDLLAGVDPTQEGYRSEGEIDDMPVVVVVRKASE